MGSGVLHSPAHKVHLCGYPRQVHRGDLVVALVRERGHNSCELCHGKARVYCLADEAELCLACDRAVHSANFLVSRHSREMLCRSCGHPCTLSVFTGAGIDDDDDDDDDGRRHCLQCLRSRRTERNGRTKFLSVAAASSSEAGSSSSCCTESRSSDHGAVGGVAAACYQNKRLHVLALSVEEGCGDSDDPRHGFSHARPLNATATSTSSC